MYTVIAEHGVAILAVVALVIGALLVRLSARRGGERAASILRGYRALDPVHRLMTWMLLASGSVHLGLVVGHEPSGFTALYLIGTIALAFVTWLVLAGRRWRRWTRLVLVGSIVAYFVSSVSGEAPDQLGIATKLVELTALGIAMTPSPGRRLRHLGASAATIAMVVFTGVGAWVGAFVSGDGGHHLGETPPPGVLLPVGVDREATAEEKRHAAEFHRATAEAIEKYNDPAIAAAAGYDMSGLYGISYHASNKAFQDDGRIFDPERPETLVYATDGDAVVLLGALFEMPEAGLAGPAIGGPETVWHAHDHVCFSLTPPALAGLTSPFGGCPIGSITMPVTAEMIHVWTVPGAPEEWGDLDDEWVRSYLAAG